ncbi:hypothetical protein RHGRI_014459 [Rhododendron griersonianum]|uniref:NADH dehydrogenase subunit 3 n=1 Tax=Rhododendron griersonianum TaxID=479676 RepID=A0AAV6K9T4_9ERIC|nr:hypothetical protein RHGRI_014459 [Rhododendron griersonianum]
MLLLWEIASTTFLIITTIVITTTTILISTTPQLPLHPFGLSIPGKSILLDYPSWRPPYKDG